MIFADTIGWIGTSAFMLSGASFANDARRAGKTDFSWLSIATLVVGESGALYKAVDILSWIFIINYLFGLICVGIVIKYKIWPRRQDGCT